MKANRCSRNLRSKSTFTSVTWVLASREQLKQYPVVPLAKDIIASPITTYLGIQKGD